jgi:RNA polymerase sigma-70 factor (sigma-E family)
MTAREPDDSPTRHFNVTETLVAGTASGSVPAVTHGRVRPDRRDDARAEATVATQALTALYSAHYRSLVRLAVLLLHDVATAEEVVQDSFVALHLGIHRLRDSDKALAYLRSAVVNRSRSVLRHRVVVERNPAKPAPNGPSAEHGALELLERSAVVAALRGLPVRQREVVVLRYYADLSEAQIAETMGITRGAVKSHTSRAMGALRAVLEPGSSAGARD